MNLSPEETRASINRLKRVNGQLANVIAMMEAGADCEKVALQISACAKAVQKAGLTVVATGMRHCATEDPDNLAGLEKVLLSLA